MFVDYGTSSVHHRCGRYNPLVRRAGVDRILSRCGRGGRQGLVSFAGRVPNVRSRWFAVFGNRRRPMIGMPTHSQDARRDRPRRHKGIDVSHPRCIMVSSRKHRRSVLRYRPDRGRDHVVGADPSQGMAGRVREPRRWWLGAGPSEGSGPAFFAFSVPPGPAWRDGRHVPGIYNESRNQDTRRVPKNPSPARRSMTRRHVSGRRVNHLPVLEHSPCRGIRPEGTRPDRRETGSPCAVWTRGQPAGDRRYGRAGR